MMEATFPLGGGKHPCFYGACTHQEGALMFDLAPRHYLRSSGKSNMPRLKPVFTFCARTGWRRECFTPGTDGPQNELARMLETMMNINTEIGVIPHSQKV